MKGEDIEKKYSKLSTITISTTSSDEFSSSDAPSNTSSDAPSNTANETHFLNINKNEFINKDFVKMCKDYKYIPTVMPAVKRIIVLGDIHGDYNVAIKMLKIGKVIDVLPDNNIKWIGGDTYVVQVGDQIDRCRPKSVDNLLCSDPKATINDEASDIKILNLFTDLHKQAVENGGMVISLLGNHELLNVIGNLDYVSFKGIEEFNHYSDLNNKNIKFNSGREARKYAFQPGGPIGVMLGCSRLSSVIIGNNLFVHAGMIDIILDKLDIKKVDNLESINIMIKKWLLGLINKNYIKHIISFDKESAKTSMFWTRILGGIPPNVSNENPICIKNISRVLKLFNIGKIIIGHTPQSMVKGHEHGINSTCGDSIWRVDNASSSAFHGFDEDYMKTGKINKHREPQVLEIIDDKNFNVL